MKNILFLFAFLTFSLGAFAQKEKGTKSDTTKIKLGKDLLIYIEDVYEDDSWGCDSVKKDSTGLDATIAIDFGMNGYLTSNDNITLPANLSELELDYPRSKSFGVSLMMNNADIIKDRLYISPGIGINWNSYIFRNNISIQSNGDTTAFLPDSLLEYDKYKLRATYLQVPVLLGVRIGKLKNPLGIQAGLVGSYRIGSMIKQKYTVDGVKHKDKIRDDFNLSPFKLEAIARISISEFGFFCRYSLTPLFEKDKAPELYPFSVGITIGGFMSNK